MKRLSDYKGDAAIDLWADLLTPISNIFSDPEIRNVMQSGKSKMDIAKEVLRLRKADAVEILTRIDDTPLDGLNIILRLITLLAEIGENETVRSFFGFAAQEKMESESSGSATESTEASEN